MFNKLQDLTGLAAVGRKQPGPYWRLDLPTLAPNAVTQPLPADTADTAVSSMPGKSHEISLQRIPGAVLHKTWSKRDERWQECPNRWQVFPLSEDDQRCKQQMVFTNPRDQNRRQFPQHQSLQSLQVLNCYLHHRQTTSTYVNMQNV